METATAKHDEETIKKLIEELRNTPDFAHLPFPKDWYEKYNIPLLQPASMKEFLTDNTWFKCHYDPRVEREIRKKPVPGGVRPVPEPEVIPVDIITKPVVDETDEDNQQEMPQMTEDSKESSETKPQQS